MAVKALLVVVAVFVAAWAFAVWRVGVVPEGCDGRVDVALVPSGAPGRRVRRAAELYRAGGAERVVISGAGFGGDSARVLAKTATTAGIPADKIVLELHARSTEANMTRSCTHAELEDVVSVAVVTDRHHLRRAVQTARKQCPRWRVCGVPVDADVTAWGRCREGLKLLWYVLSGRA